MTDRAFLRLRAPNRMRRGRDVVYFGAGQGVRATTALYGPSSPSNAGMRQKTHVPAGCDENERLLRQNSSIYHQGMSSSFFLVSISFSSQRGSRLILLGTRAILPAGIGR